MGHLIPFSDEDGYQPVGRALDIYDLCNPGIKPGLLGGGLPR